MVSEGQEASQQTKMHFFIGIIKGLSSAKSIQKRHSICSFPFQLEWEWAQKKVGSKQVEIFWFIVATGNKPIVNKMERFDHSSQPRSSMSISTCGTAHSKESKQKKGRKRKRLRMDFDEEDEYYPLLLLLKFIFLNEHLQHQHCSRISLAAQNILIHQ